MTGSSRHEKSCAAPGATTRHASSRLTRIAASLAVAALAASALNVSTAMAKNQWADYHWSLPANETQLVIEVNDCQEEPVPELNYWHPVDSFSGPNDDWDWEIGLAGGAITIMNGSCPANIGAFSDPIGAANSGAFDTRAAEFVDTPTVNSFNGSFGNSGWVGLAIVALPSNDSHIFYGETYLNDYYPANSTTYNQPLRMRKVQCQEIGHTFGLDHVKKDTSCMYSSRAFIGSVYTPSPHDGDVVNSITHDDGAPPPTPEEDGGGDGGGPCAKNPNHWKCQAQGPVFRGKATWAERYDSQDEMFEAADVVVSATVLNGSMFDRVVGAPGRGLPVSQAVLQIREVFKGKANGVVRIEHTRGLGLEIEDDPGYVNGDDYLLFLRQLGAKTYRVVNPQGRIAQ